MNTELPQDDQNEEQAAAEQTPAEETVPAPEETVSAEESAPAAEETVVEPVEVVETIEVVETVEVVIETAEETPVAEETSAEETSAEETSAEETSAEETSAEEVAAPQEESTEQEVSAPQLTLGESESDAEAGSEEEVEEKPYVEPTIRGRIDKFGTAMGTGRRKTSVARVRIKDGNGEFVVNGRPLEDYFCLERDQKMIKAPLNAVEELGKVDIWVRVHGGGITGQTGAVVLGIARALQVKNPTNHPTLAEGGYLTRDSRMVERKKYGQAKARKSFQFSKR